MDAEVQPEVDEDVVLDPRGQAEVYVDLAKRVLTTFVDPACNTRHHLRAWWKAETDNRKDYGLSKAQVDDLLNHCRILAEGLPEIAPPPGEVEPEPEPKRRAAAKPSRRPAI